MHYIWITLAILFSISNVAECANQRDYVYEGAQIYNDQEPDYCDDDDEDYCHFEYTSNELCVDCFLNTDDYHSYFSYRNHHGVDFSAIAHRNDGGKLICICGKPRIYAGYLHFLYRNDLPFLKKQISYTKKHPVARIFWPENSVKAMHISNTAIPLFKDLIYNSSLNKVRFDSHLARNFMVRSWYLSLYNCLHKALCATCFYFSDYFQVCSDIKQFSRQHFTYEECSQIENKLQNILEILDPLFRDIYADAQSIYKMPEIEQELEFIENINNDWATITQYCPACYPSRDPSQPQIACEYFELDPSLIPPPSGIGEKLCRTQIDELIPLALPNEDESPPKWCETPLHLSRGMLLNDHQFYSDAIQTLSRALELDPKCSDAYLERAHAYLETGQWNLALADYAKINELLGRSPPRRPTDDMTPLGPLDYGQGLCMGALEGGYTSVADFGPALVGSMRGFLQGLWSFACSPNQVSQELIESSRMLILAIRSQSCLESLQMVVPELRVLCNHWDVLSDYDRGRKMGYIIGKYGLDIFIPLTGVKLYGKYRALKAANTMFTLDCMACSEVGYSAVLKESNCRLAKRLEISQQTQSGKLILKNANQATHIMTKPHLWDRAITLTGCAQEDCRQAIAFLEKHSVVSPANAFPPYFEPVKGPARVRIDTYRKTIGDIRVEVITETKLDTGVTVLQNAFVINPKYIR